MTHQFTEAELEAYLDEALSAEEMAKVETLLRSESDLTDRLRAIHGRRDAGVHSLGEIWRRHRVSCPTREQLGSYLLQVLEGEEQEYIEFHLQEINCRYCHANLDDLRLRKQEIEAETQSRRRRYFQSSAGFFDNQD